MTEAAFRNESTGAKPGVYNQTIQQQNGYEVLHYIQIQEDHTTMGDPQSPNLTGVQLNLDRYLGGKAHISAAPEGFDVSQQGNAQQYLTSLPDMTHCSYKYMDPMTADIEWKVPSVIAKINQMMFAIATDISREDPNNDYGQSKNYTATMYRDSIHYVSYFPYVWGAVASTLSCVLLVLPVYWGFWELGRKVRDAVLFFSRLKESWGRE